MLALSRTVISDAVVVLALWFSHDVSWGERASAGRITGSGEGQLTFAGAYPFGASAVARELSSAGSTNMDMGLAQPVLARQQPAP